MRVSHFPPKVFLQVEYWTCLPGDPCLLENLRDSHKESIPGPGGGGGGTVLSAPKSLLLHLMSCRAPLFATHAVDLNVCLLSLSPAYLFLTTLPQSPFLKCPFTRVPPLPQIVECVVLLVRDMMLLRFSKTPAPLPLKQTRSLPSFLEAMASSAFCPVSSCCPASVGAHCCASVHQGFGRLVHKGFIDKKGH